MARSALNGRSHGAALSSSQLLSSCWCRVALLSSCQLAVLAVVSRSSNEDTEAQELVEELGGLRSSSPVEDPPPSTTEQPQEATEAQDATLILEGSEAQAVAEGPDDPEAPEHDQGIDAQGAKRRKKYTPRFSSDSVVADAAWRRSWIAQNWTILEDDGGAGVEYFFGTLSQEEPVVVRREEDDKSSCACYRTGPLAKHHRDKLYPIGHTGQRMLREDVTTCNCTNSRNASSSCNTISLEGGHLQGVKCSRNTVGCPGKTWTNDVGKRRGGRHTKFCDVCVAERREAARKEDEEDDEVTSSSGAASSSASGGSSSASASSSSASANAGAASGNEANKGDGAESNEDKTNKSDKDEGSDTETNKREEMRIRKDKKNKKKEKKEKKQKKK